LPLGYFSFDVDADVDVEAVHEFFVGGFPDSDVPVVALFIAEVDDELPVVVPGFGGELAGTSDDLPRFLDVNCHFAAPRRRDWAYVTPCEFACFLSNLSRSAKKSTLSEMRAIIISSFSLLTFHFLSSEFLSTCFR